jgi:hypothetical protein
VLEINDVELAVVQDVLWQKQAIEDLNEDMYFVVINIYKMNNDQHCHFDNHNDCRHDIQDLVKAEIGVVEMRKIIMKSSYSTWCRRDQNRSLPSVDASIRCVHWKMNVIGYEEDHLLLVWNVRILLIFTSEKEFYFFPLISDEKITELTNHF